METYDALSVNGGGTRVAVAARSAIRLYSTPEGRLRFDKELKYPRGKRNSFYSSGSICWNPVTDEYIASTSIDGVVGVWNTESGEQEKNYKLHKTGATKVTFSYHDRNLMVSGGKDGSIVSYDLRHKGPLGMFKAECEQAVRDIQFTPNSNVFITADDSGFVRYWDARKPGDCVKEFNAHFGAVNSISIQSNNVIATAGKDKFLRVWTVSSDETLHLKYWVETMSSVSKIMWDPYHEYHLLSCSSTSEGSIHIWDIRRAFLPYASFDAHNGACTDIAWLRSAADVFVSCGRDGRLLRHRAHDGEVPARHVSLISVDTSSHGVILTAVKQHVRNCNIRRKLSNDKKHPMGRVEPSLLSLSSPISIAADMSQNAFIVLAKDYVLKGDSFLEICNTNSRIARKYGQHQTAYSWRIIGTLCDPIFAEEDTSEETLGADKRRGSKTAHDKLPTEPEPEQSEEKKATTIETFFPNGIPDTLTAETDMYFGPEELNLQGMSSEPFPSVHALFGNGRAQANIPEDFFEPRQELPEWSSSESLSGDSLASFPMKPPLSDDCSDVDNASNTSGLSDEDIVQLAMPKSLVFDPLPMVVEMLYNFSNEVYFT
ncbi:hypothetical protein QR680_000129 [Steinernema hermaphroditum]|uniref:GATOR2 complex protein WDR24 n=1 Tax=Steinernema hermaphroditum TaxID=289476 RepID=A0AA39GVH9_9BILA|nr:hypothetical protein QR680_000129 [Steinernema hermaphroditum]